MIQTLEPVPVRLHGPLAAKYGAEHRFAVATPREAVRALSANFPGFRRDFLEIERWTFVVDGELRDGEAFVDAPLSREIDIVPVIDGEAFLGAALIGFLIPSIAGTLAANILGGLLVAGLLLGASLLFTPSAPKDTKKDPAKDDNYAFSGPENIVSQGAAVPVLYGRAFCGSVVVSAGLELAEEFGTVRPNSAFDGPHAHEADVVPGPVPTLGNVKVGNKQVQGPSQDGHPWTYVSHVILVAPAGRYEVDIFRNSAKTWQWDKVRGYLATVEGTILP